MNNQISWANPSAAGIVGLCCVVIPLSLLNLGLLPPESAPVIIAWLLCGGLVQVFAGLIEFKRGGLLFSTPFLVFGFMLCITPALGEITKIWIKDPAVPAAVGGAGFLVIAVYVAAFFISTGLVSRFLFALCAVLDLGLWFIGLTDLGLINAGTFGWLCLLVFALGMLYIACALFLNEMFQKQILPIGAPLFQVGAQVESGKNVAS
jgi:succinate-acetate transporter protein